MTPHRPGSAKTRGHRLTDADRRLLCEFHTQNPKMKHEHIGQVFGVERSTVSKILKHKSKWTDSADVGLPRFQNRFEHVGSPAVPLEAPAPPLAHTVAAPEPITFVQPAHPSTPASAKEGGRPVKKGRHPELEATLSEWGRGQTLSGAVLTDEQVQTKAREIAASMGLEPGSFKASAGWLDNFRARAGYKAGRFSLTPAPLQQSQPGQTLPPVQDAEAASGTATSQARPHLQIIQPHPPQFQINETGLGYYGSDWPQPTSGSSGGWTSPSESRASQSASRLGGSSGNLLDLPGVGTSLDSASNLLPSGLSGSYARYIRPDGSSYSSAESSPYPSPVDALVASQSQSSSASSAFSHHPWSTPTQQSSNVRPDSAASSLSNSQSPAYRMQQAQQVGMAFQLNLDGNAEYQHGGQNIELPAYEQPPDARAAFIQETAQLAGDAGRASNTAKPNYSLRSRPHLIAQPPSGRTSRNRQISQPSPLSMSDGNLQEFPLQGIPDGEDFAGQTYEGMATGVLSFPDRASLHRSNTDPIPLVHSFNPHTENTHTTIDSAGMEYSYQTQIDMDCPIPHNEQDRPSSDETTRHSQANSQVQPQPQQGAHQGDSLMDSVITHGPRSPRAAAALARSRISPTHGARRATVSTGSPSDLGVHRLSGSFMAMQATTPTFSHFGMLPRGIDLNEPVTLEDAYMALRKVLGYVHTTQRGIATPSSAGSATVSAMAASHGSAGGPKIAPGQLQVLEGLLGQFWDAHVAKLHSLTPPSSG